MSIRALTMMGFENMGINFEGFSFKEEIEDNKLRLNLASKCMRNRAS